MNSFSVFVSSLDFGPLFIIHLWESVSWSSFSCNPVIMLESYWYGGKVVGRGSVYNISIKPKPVCEIVSGLWPHSISAILLLSPDVLLLPPPFSGSQSLFLKPWLLLTVPSFFVETGSLEGERVRGNPLPQAGIRLWQSPFLRGGLPYWKRSGHISQWLFFLSPHPQRKP